jgi:hypothetical protein
MSLRRIGRLAILAVMVGALAIVAACAEPVASTATGALLTVELRGGMCVGGPCGTTVILERDGRVHGATKPPNGLGVVPAAQLKTLETLIAATDFAVIKGRPFTGRCPTAFDGQEVVLEFATNSGVQRIATCQVDVDWGHPLFVALSTALGPFIALPTA